MIATITNEHASITIGDPVLIDTGADLGPARVVATGGARYFELPFPFTHAVIEPGDTFVAPFHFEHLSRREAGGHGTFTSNERLNQMTAAGIISITVAAQTSQNAKDFAEIAGAVL